MQTYFHTVIKDSRLKAGFVESDGGKTTECE